MDIIADKVFDDALSLPSDARVVLVERALARSLFNDSISPRKVTGRLALTGILLSSCRVTLSFGWTSQEGCHLVAGLQVGCTGT